VADMVTHWKPARDTATFRENHFISVADGHPIMEKAQCLILPEKKFHARTLRFNRKKGNGPRNIKI
jgi:hypothetical protein